MVRNTSPAPSGVGEDTTHVPTISNVPLQPEQPHAENSYTLANNGKKKKQLVVLTLILVAVIIGLVSFLALSHRKTILSPASPTVAAGRYEKTDGSRGFIEVSNVTGNQFSINGQAYWVGNATTGNVNQGEVYGIVTLQGSKAIYNQGSCQLQIEFHSNALTVKDNEACGGLNVTFTGEYQRKTSDATQQSTDWKTFISGNQEYQTNEKPNPNDKTKTDVYIKNVQTGEEKLLITLADAYQEHYHGSEYHNGDLYIIRRIGDVRGQNWTDQLWKYTSPTNGQAIFSVQGLDFRAAKDESMVAVTGDGTKITFINNSGSVLKELTTKDLWNHQVIDPNYSASLITTSLNSWSKDSTALWGRVGGPGPLVNNFFQINVADWKVAIFDSPLTVYGQNEIDWNVDTADITYSDYPLFLDADSDQRFIDSKKTVTLYVYDLKAKKSVTVTSSKGKQFKPKWLDNNTIEYDNPNGSGRVKYLIKY